MANFRKSRDNQIAASHGRPRAINAEDSNVRPLRAEDFDAGDEDALLFMQSVQITSILGDITEHYRRGTLSDRKKIDFEDSLRRWLRSIPPSLRLYHPETKKPTEYNFKVRQLHVLYFTSLIILFRQDSKNDPPSPVSLLAASFVSGSFEDYLTYEDIAHLSVTSIFYLMVASLLQLSYQRFPSLATHRSQEIEIMRLSLDGLKKRFPSAIGAERVVNQMMKQSTTLSDTPQSTRMVLTPEQKEFFAPFGPDLCRKWASVFDTRQELLVGIDDFAVARKGSGITGFASQGNQQDIQDNLNGTLQRESTPLDADPAWDPNGLLIFSQDDDTLFSSEQALDSVGRWWWADWVPEADLDFLSKSL